MNLLLTPPSFFSNLFRRLSIWKISKYLYAYTIISLVLCYLLLLVPVSGCPHKLLLLIHVYFYFLSLSAIASLLYLPVSMLFNVLTHLLLHRSSFIHVPTTCDLDSIISNPPSQLQDIYKICDFFSKPLRGYEECNVRRSFDFYVFLFAICGSDCV